MTRTETREWTIPCNRCGGVALVLKGRLQPPTQSTPLVCDNCR